MNKYPAFTIVINRHAASGRSRYSLRVVTKQLKNRHLTYRICSTPKDGAEQLLCDLINNQELKYSIPLIMGGDGTLNQAINGIKKSSFPQTALAYIPAGSGNDFANALNIPQHQEVRALQQIIDAVIPQTINLGKIQFQNQVHFFINNIGIGLDANMVHYANKSTLKIIFNHLHLSKLIYISQLSKGLKQHPFQANLTIGQQQLAFNNIIACIVSNHPYIGSGVPILPTASAFENNLDFILVDKLNFQQVTKLAYQLFTSGKHLQSPLVHHYQLHQFTIKTNPQQYGQIDGEDLGNQVFDLKFSTARQQFWL